MKRNVFPNIPPCHKPGVYKITDTTTGEIYIGSSVDIYTRLKSHESSFRTGRQPIKLQQAFNSGHSFTCEILAALSSDHCTLDLQMKERDYINEYNTVKNGFNTNTPDVTPYNYYSDTPGLSVKFELSERFDALKKTTPFSDFPVRPLDHSIPWPEPDGKKMRCEVWIPEEIADRLIDKLIEDRISLDKFICDCISSYLSTIKQ